MLYSLVSICKQVNSLSLGASTIHLAVHDEMREHTFRYVMTIYTADFTCENHGRKRLTIFRNGEAGVFA
jgi:hypothetical protein